jgi:hypothetical protein
MGQCLCWREKIVNDELQYFSKIVVPDEFNVVNGLIGMKRDIVCMLVKKMYWEDDKKTRNVINLLDVNFFFLVDRC